MAEQREGRPHPVRGRSEFGLAILAALELDSRGVEDIHIVIPCDGLVRVTVQRFVYNTELSELAHVLEGYRLVRIDAPAAQEKAETRAEIRRHSEEGEAAERREGQV